MHNRLNAINVGWFFVIASLSFGTFSFVEALGVRWLSCGIYASVYTSVMGVCMGIWLWFTAGPLYDPKDPSGKKWHMNPIIFAQRTASYRGDVYAYYALAVVVFAMNLFSFWGQTVWSGFNSHPSDTDDVSSMRELNRWQSAHQVMYISNFFLAVFGSIGMHSFSDSYISHLTNHEEYTGLLTQS